MADYFGTSINESPTIVLEAGKDIEGAQGIALAIKNGKAEKPTAGANVIGLSLFTNDEKVKAGDDVDIQVKDIGKWIAGEAVAVGDELTTNAEGKAVKAAAGKLCMDALQMQPQKLRKISLPRTIPLHIRLCREEHL